MTHTYMYLLIAALPSSPVPY